MKILLSVCLCVRESLFAVNVGAIYSFLSVYLGRVVSRADLFLLSASFFSPLFLLYDLSNDVIDWIAIHLGTCIPARQHEIH